MTRFPSLDDLHAFVLAAQFLSVSRTASALSLTQSAVSRKLKALEEQLNVQLFTRTNRGLALTDEGRQYLSKIEGPIEQIRRATGGLLPRQNSLVVGVDGAFARTWLVKRLTSFRLHHPEIDLELRLGASMDSMTGRALPEGLNAAIVLGRPPWPGYLARSLFALEEFPVCSPDLLARAPLRSPSDLLAHSIIHEGDRAAWRRWLAHVGSPEISGGGITVDDSLACLTMAVEGQGIAIGDNLTCTDYLAEGVLIRPFDDAVTLDDSFHLVIAESNSHSAQVAAFSTWLAGFFDASS
jgi:LysR family transcriptional regulator, glycine cleavage system transcriptional activator